MALASGTHQVHVIHVSLGAVYLVPVLAGVLWCGLRGGVVLGLGVTAAFAWQAGVEETRAWMGLPERWAFIAVFWVVGVGGGVLVDLQRAERARSRAMQRDAERRTVLEALASLAAALGSHDPYVKSHGEHVGAVAAALGTELGLTAERVETLRLAGVVHDIGKLGVPDDILLRPGDLSAGERGLVERHPDIAAAILQPLSGAAGIAEIVRCHHECPDGSGYPRHLRGTEIPLEARLLRVADVFCSVTDSRPYKPSVPVPAALETLRAMAGAKLDPDGFGALEHLVGRGAVSVRLSASDLNQA
jgi:HD-GYP domain-containing protein (c-di-GMP phosphodiesterase class II)